jgi:hypothetical protein
MTYYKYDEKTIKVQSRFESNYDKTDTCWNYKSRLNKEGYGHLSINIDGKEHTLRAHRYSWMIANKKDWPEESPVARHTCNNPSCVNPEHIVPGTQKENVKDMIDSGRSKLRNGWPKGLSRKNKE